MKKFYIVLACLFAVFSHVNAVTILGWSFEASCNLSSTTTAMGAASSSASRGGGVGGANDCYSTGNCTGSSSIGGSNWNENSEADAVTAGDYFEFEVNADATSTLQLTGVCFNQRRTGTGPPNLAIYVDGSNEATLLGATTNSTTCGALAATFSSGTITVSPGGTSIIRVYGWGGSSSAGTLRVDDFEVKGNIILPVELISFDVEPNKDNTLLTWQTASEINNDHFQIEHSTDGRNFNSIGEVDGNGDSFSINDYSFTHDTPANGINYYRLKQVDYDGAFEYSHIILTPFGEKEDWLLYPTTSANNLNIEWEEGISAQAASIFSFTGNKVLHQSLDAEAGNAQINIDHLPEGSYIIQLKSGRQILSKRFVKI